MLCEGLREQRGAEESIALDWRGEERREERREAMESAAASDLKDVKSIAGAPSASALRWSLLGRFISSRKPGALFCDLFLSGNKVERRISLSCQSHCLYGSAVVCLKFCNCDPWLGLGFS
jgi:hypothetical protein